MDLFDVEVYRNRRTRLHALIESGLALFIGNKESPMNYPANPYNFRQDSDFLYYFGIDLPDLAGVMDIDTGDDYIFGNDLDVEDIVWMGRQSSVSHLGARSGVSGTYPLSKLSEIINEACQKGRKVHFLPPYRSETILNLASLLNVNPYTIKDLTSTALVKAVISMRSVKEPVEVAEIEKAVNISYEMHVTAMKMCKPGIKEQEIYGRLMGIAYSYGASPSFPFIISINGQTLHNHNHSNILEAGRLMVNDSGVETSLHYTSDITRTTPVGGKFSSKQKDIYEIVLKANSEAIRIAKPGITNRDLHKTACRIIASGLKEAGLMKGDTEAAVEMGAHALFFPHGLGHMLGLDAHDMEALGEKHIGYSDKVVRSDQFGLAYLRFALPLEAGHVLTIEPGCYFIPELIDSWKSVNKFAEFIDYRKVESYLDFGGIRIEDNILITEDSNRILGKPIPKSIDEVEGICI